MSRLVWMVRREIWEHKAIWVAPLIVLACLLLLTFRSITIGGTDPAALVGHSMKIYGGLVAAVFLVMGIIAFFYALDSLYADRRDRSVLFWKSLPLSDAETVLAKFVVAIVVIPLIAALAGVVAQALFMVQDPLQLIADDGVVKNVRLSVDARIFQLGPVLFLCAMLWYAPLVGYLMLVSAWAPRSPFLWAILPPVAAALGEGVLLRSEVAGEFIQRRLLGVFDLLGGTGQVPEVATDRGITMNLSGFDAREMMSAVAASTEVWAGVLAAALLLAAAIWVRRYRDETA
jgi:ABC-2 type transport system permease protein